MLVFELFDSRFIILRALFKDPLLEHIHSCG
jgi:hypothetical protein